MVAGCKNELNNVNMDGTNEDSRTEMEEWRKPKK